MLRNTFRPALKRANLCLRCRYASASPEAAPGAPPLLLKIRADMKAALKAKDTNRLDVLRALLAEYTNAGKTSKPIRTDLQLLSVLRKRAAASRAAAEEFQAAKRDDLRAKEEAQALVLDEYAGSVEMVDDEEIKKIVEESVAAMRVQGERTDLGSVLKRVLGEQGPLAGKPVDKGDVAKAVKDMLGSENK